MTCFNVEKLCEEAHVINSTSYNYEIIVGLYISGMQFLWSLLINMSVNNRSLEVHGLCY